MAKDQKILASDVNSLFNRLNEVRKAHYATLQTSALKPEFNTTPAIVGELVKDQTSLMKQYINTLRTSTFLTSITDAQINAITTPDVGDLLEFSSYDIATSLTDTIESYPSSFTSNFNHNGTNHTCHANFGTNHTCHANFGVNHTCFANFGSDFTNFANFGSDFTNFSFSTSPTTPHTNQRFDGRFFSN